MSEYSLRQGLSFCRTGKAIIFLDVSQDKYRMLAPALIDPFNNFIAGGSPSPPDIRRLEHAGIIECGGHDPCPVAASIEAADRQHPAALDGPFRPIPTLTALWAVHRERRRLQARGLAALVKDVRASSLMSRAPGDIRGANEVLRAFEHSRYWQSSSELCLPRSFALAKMLAARSFIGRVVLAVRLDPFRAHCWVQAGGFVLNDTPEEVAKFTPILVL